jgi:hypothetical protein
VFKLLDEMGLRLSVDMVEQAAPELALLRSKLAEPNRKPVIPAHAEIQKIVSNLRH